MPMQILSMEPSQILRKSLTALSSKGSWPGITQGIFISQKPTEPSHSEGQLAQLPWMKTVIGKKGIYLHNWSLLHETCHIFASLADFFLIASQLSGTTLLLVCETENQYTSVLSSRENIRSSGSHSSRTRTQMSPRTLLRGLVSAAKYDLSFL